MEQGRKIFYFLRFLDELGIMKQILNDEKYKDRIVLSLFSTICSFFYYLCNNILWGVKIGVLSDFFTKPAVYAWTRLKNFSLLIRVILNVFEKFILLRKSERYVIIPYCISVYIERKINYTSAFKDTAT